jgi:hypothetical protein
MMADRNRSRTCLADRWASPEDQRKNEQDREQNKNHFGYPSCTAGKPAETKCCRDNGKHQEQGGPLQHGALLGYR